MTKRMTIGEAARRLGLEVDTVRKLETAGEIRAVRTRGGHRRFTEEEIDRFRKRRCGRRKSSQKRNPSTGEFAGHDTVSANDQDELDEELPFEDWDAEELASYRPPPPPRLTPVVPPAPVAPQPLPQLFDPAWAERLHLQNIKAMGRGATPWNTPAEWQGKVVADLERFVTLNQFPLDLPLFTAREIVVGRVEAVLRPWREAEDKAKRVKEAEKASERQRNALITRGNDYARRETSAWDVSAKLEAWEEVREVLGRDVKSNWTETEVEDCVDEVLDQWDDNDGEDDEED
ncbi:MAG TPA: helix-turn-helix domain-containing protein [Actinomycetota bacterium]|nr:helix-turn-helix domain-containing protein [Actinomycetota bacterium]